MGQKLVTINWNKLIISHGDMKCLLVIVFLVQNILARSWKFKKVRRMWQNTKHKINKSMYRKQEVVKCCLFLILLAFYEHIHLGSNQSLRHLLCFSYRCKGLIRVYPSCKKILINDWENIFAYWEESEQSEALANMCGLFQKQLGGLGWWQQYNSKKTS